MFEKIVELIKSFLPEDTFVIDDEITEDTVLRTDLAMNSLDLMGLVSKIEDEYQIEIQDRDIVKIQTVGDIVRYLEKTLDKKG